MYGAKTKEEQEQFRQAERLLVEYGLGRIEAIGVLQNIPDHPVIPKNPLAYATLYIQTKGTFQFTGFCPNHKFVDLR